MRICMVLESSYPADIRVRKEASSLEAAGFDVSLLCKYDGEEQRRERVGPLDVTRVAVYEEYGSLSEPVNGGYYLGKRVNLPWKRAIADQFRREGFDALHVHDLPLVRTALQWRGDRDVPVVADLHENWPEAVRQYRRRKSLTDRVVAPKSALDLVSTPVWRLKRIERSCVQAADRVVAVVEEGKEHYVSDCGADPDEVAVVPNYVDPAEFGDGDTATVDVDADFVLLYIGTIGGQHRGLETVIRAMPSITDHVPGAQFLVVGSGPYVSELRDLCAQLGVEDAVRFTGWVDFEELPGYVAASDVGLVPHCDNPHTATTVPHKLTQYMTLGKPVIVSDVAPLKRIVTDAGSGLVFAAGDPSDFAEKALRLVDRPDVAAECGANARRAVERSLNWQTAGAAIVEMYEGLENRRLSKPGTP